AYINLGYKVVVIDNLSTGFRKNLNPKAKFYKVDIGDLPKIEKIFQKEKPQIVNHHAAIAEVVKSLRDPLPTLNVNVIGTINLLLAAGKIRVKKFIFSSTGGAIYGQPDKIPADENTPAIPLSPYGLSKLLGEECIKFYAKHYGFDYLIFRYPNVYGPRQNPKGEAGVVAIFSGLMREGKQPTIFGDGSKTRDYVHIDDIVRANIIGLHKGKNEIFNLGWAKKISDQKIFDTIAKNLNFKKPPIYAPFRHGEVYQIALSAKKARKNLGWQPQISLEEGIKKTVKTIIRL
ncbi:MAG: hypothetical protein AUK06_01945, partial [Parcubacteria group bacterium CG2_30_36_18]